MSLLLPLAFQALAVVAAAAAPAGAPCPFDTWEREIVQGSSECGFLNGLEADFSRLAKAAGFKEGEISLNREVDTLHRFNATYSRVNRTVRLYRGFAACALAHPGVAQFALAHEIGHAVQDREGIKIMSNREPLQEDPSVDKVAKNAFNRRFEAQADRIGQDLLARAGYSYDVSKVVQEMTRECDGSSEYLARHTHPSAQARTIEALHAADRRQAEVASRLPGRIHGFEEKAAPEENDPPDGKKPFALEPGRYRPWVSMAELNAQGRTTKGLTTNDDVPLPREAQQLKLDGEKVLVAPGVAWRPNIGQLALYSPDELVVLATRAQLLAGVDFKGAVAAGISYIIRHRLWDLLPGSVVHFDADDPEAEEAFARESVADAKARQAAAGR